MLIGFTGAREGMTDRQKSGVAKLLEFYQPKEFHHGDCIGADEQAHVICDNVCTASIIIHPPTVNKYRAFCYIDRAFFSDQCRHPYPYITRNHHIVDETDILIAAPKGPEILRSGTWATIRYAQKQQKEIIIVEP